MKATVAVAVVLAGLWAAPSAGGSPPSWLTLDAGETSEQVNWRGGSGTLQVWGAFTGAPTVTLEWRSHVAAPWLEPNATDCTLTAAGFCSFSIGNGALRLVVTGGTGADIVAGYIGQPNQAALPASAPPPASTVATSVDYDLDGTPNIFNIAGQTNIDANDDAGLDFFVSATRVGCTAGKLFRFPISSGSPGGGAAGDTYYDATNNTICVHNGVGFVELIDGITPCA